MVPGISRVYGQLPLSVMNSHWSGVANCSCEKCLTPVSFVKELESSLMPAGLAFGLTDRELRDLLAYLER
jgi:hypothetical protein